MENTGTCHYCGQSVMLETVGELTEEQLDAMATEICKCPEAQSAQRQKERREKIESFVKRHFDEPQYHFIEEVIEIVEAEEVSEVTFKLTDDRSVKIWLDKDYYLNLKIKHTEEDELKV